MVGSELGAYQRMLETRDQQTPAPPPAILTSTTITDQGADYRKLMSTLPAFRLVRIIPFVPSVHTLLDVCVKSIVSLCPLIMVYAVVTFTWAVLGVIIFGSRAEGFVKVGSGHGEIVVSSDTYDLRHAHFGTTLGAMQLLISMSTGEDYPGVIEKGVEMWPAPEMVWVASLYLLSYVLLTKYFIGSLCVLTVVWKMTTHMSSVNGLAMEVVDSFRAAWKQYDGRGDGEIKAGDLLDFLKTLDAPLGVNAQTSALETELLAHKVVLATGVSMEAAEAAPIGELTFRLFPSLLLRNVPPIMYRVTLPYPVTDPHLLTPSRLKFSDVLVAVHYISVHGHELTESSSTRMRRKMARDRIRKFKVRSRDRIRARLDFSNRWSQCVPPPPLTSTRHWTPPARLPRPAVRNGTLHSRVTRQRQCTRRGCQCFSRDGEGRLERAVTLHQWRRARTRVRPVANSPPARLPSEVRWRQPGFSTACDILV